MNSIDLSLLAAFAGVVALVVCYWRGAAYAFLNVYLPTLLLLPDQARAPLPGQFNFSECAIIPIAIFYFWESRGRIKWGFTDLLVLAFAGSSVVADCINIDFVTAKNLAVKLLVAVILPYVVAKGLMASERMSAEVAKRIVVLASIVAVVSVYEFRMTVNPFRDWIAPYFPQWDAEIPSFRYGYARITGPWTHPILAGVILALAYRLARWLEWANEWPGNVPFLPISKVRFCEGALIVSSVLTISRGPWLGAAAGALVIMLLRVRHRTYLTAMAILAVFILMIPAYASFDSYARLNQFGAQDEAERSAAYRREMVDKYVEIVEERPAWGWGSGKFPVVEGMASIDNQYLLVALSWGLYTLTPLVLILVWVPLRLVRYSFAHHPQSTEASLAMTLLGIFILCAISIYTVWLGAQTQPLLFLIAGWSETLLAGRLPMTSAVVLPERRVSYGFERVMV